MSERSDRILAAIQSANLSYGELAKKTNIPKSALQRYAIGETEKIPIDRLEAIANATGVSTQYLMGWEDNNKKYFESTKVKKGIKIPVLGKVQAGIPVEAIEDIIDYEEISQELAHTGEFFGLQIRGNSMEPRMVDGDIVIVRKQPDVENGEIAIVLVNGYDATVKKIKKRPDGIMLIPINPSFEVMFYNNKEIDELPVIIIGKVIELRAKF